jgi:hypothetical protein
MTAALSFLWPGSRVLAGWWPMLQRWQPRAIWLHHLLLHRVDALVAVSGTPALARLNVLLLELLTLDAPENLAARLGMDRALLSRLLVELQTGGLIVPAGSSWALTDSGQSVLAGQGDACTSQQRRTFYLAEGDTRHPGTRFLPLENPPSTPAAQNDDWRFDEAALRACLSHTDEWKHAMGFPQDVRALLELGGTEDWRRVIIERAEQVLLVLVLGEDERLRGFPVQTSTWTLQGEQPVLDLAEGWRETLPELTEPVELAEWRQAWRAWGQPRGLPAGELEACVLEPQGTRLRVVAPQPMIERLRTARSDALKGEAWLLAGSSERTRAAALIELREDG